MRLKITSNGGHLVSITNADTGEAVPGVKSIKVDFQCNCLPRATVQLAGFQAELVLSDPKIIEGKPIFCFEGKDLFRGRLRKIFYRLAEYAVQTIAWVCRK